ncbi:hypothetical protein J2W48_001097 [Flavobacterium piscis]|uniref:Uncharacterized protein n=1 Tax=Flavobacterium piscis TaxID=1114874 RepID=A0ABU1Y4K5_9FLAO|nr:hypothetical protein [Flavobacterium piscis]
MNALPTDQIANRLIVEVHFYSPPQFQFAILKQDVDWGILDFVFNN